MLTLTLLVLVAHPARAQELLVNRSFENPVTPVNGNNFYTTIPDWTIVNVTPAQAQPFNIIRAFAGYPDNPTVTPTGGGAQFLDVNSAAGNVRQTVTLPVAGIVDISGWFSVRDRQQALSGLKLNIIDSGGTTVASTSTSFTAADPLGIWRQAARANIALAAGSYIFEIVMPNFANFDLASMVFKPALAVTKTSAAFSDPFNGTTNPKMIPAGIVQYAIAATTPASYTVSVDTILLADATPANSALVVTDIGGAGSGPALFIPGSTGLTYSFNSLASAADDIEFSNNAAASWTYTPVANANGTDPAVTHVRLRPRGTMAASSTLTFNLRYRIN